MTTVWLLMLIILIAAAILWIIVGLLHVLQPWAERRARARQDNQLFKPMIANERLRLIYERDRDGGID